MKIRKESCTDCWKPYLTEDEYPTDCRYFVYNAEDINEFEYIGCITFTGGEPTLYSDEIIDIIHFIINNKKPVGSFYIASNGLIYNPKLMLTLCEFQAYVRIEFGEENSQFSAFDISTDHCHDSLSEWQKALLSGFSFVKFKPDIDDRYLINEGNAYDNGIGCRNLKIVNNFTLCDDDTLEMVYLNARGQLLSDCDFSYETQDSLNPPNYNPNSFKETIRKMAS